jgi:hypothetical protein
MCKRPQILKEETWGIFIQVAATKAGFGEPRVQAIMEMWKGRPTDLADEKSVRIVQLACEIARPECIIRLRNALLHVHVLDVDRTTGQPFDSVAMASHYYLLAVAAKSTSTLESVLSYTTSLLRMYECFCTEYYNSGFGLLVDERNKNMNTLAKRRVAVAIACHLTQRQCGVFENSEKTVNKVITSINDGRNLKIILSGLDSLSIFLPSDPMIPPFLNVENSHPVGSKVAPFLKPFNPLRFVVRSGIRILTE